MILIDGLVLGLAIIIAGAKTGLLLPIALTLEIFLLRVTVTEELGTAVQPKIKIVAITPDLACCSRSAFCERHRLPVLRRS